MTASTIKLRNRPGLEAVVDKMHHSGVAQYSWLLTHLGYVARYEWADKKRKVIYLHRQIVEIQGIDASEYCVDHVNGNKLDNRSENLRLATKAQNMRNRGKPSSNTSGYKGVSYHRPTNKWKAYIKADYKQRYLGLFDNPEEAARSYNRAALELHGEFAHLNPL